MSYMSGLDHSRAMQLCPMKPGAPSREFTGSVLVVEQRGKNKEIEQNLDSPVAWRSCVVKFSMQGFPIRFYLEVTIREEIKKKRSQGEREAG